MMFGDSQVVTVLALMEIVFLDFVNATTDGMDLIVKFVQLDMKDCYVINVHLIIIQSFAYHVLAPF